LLARHFPPKVSSADSERFLPFFTFLRKPSAVFFAFFLVLFAFRRKFLLLFAFFGGVFRQKTPFFMQLKVIMREIFFLIIILYVYLCF